jgi:hypothetical protein
MDMMVWQDIQVILEFRDHPDHWVKRVMLES